MRNTRSKRAFITGISGQDGSYLAEFLLKKRYEVYGLARSLRKTDLAYLNPKIQKQIHLTTGDMTNTDLIKKILQKIKPNEIYNFAAISDNATAIKNPKVTLEINFKAPQRLLKETLVIVPNARVFTASSGQIFTKSVWPQRESTPFNVKDANPYSIAKIKLHQEGVLSYRNKGLFVCSGFLFNHESPRRGEKFVTKKITQGLSRIKLGLKNKLTLGNIDMKRDWGFAKDYVECAWLMLQQKTSDDYVIATNKTHTVREFVEESAKVLGINILWKGTGIKERGIDKKTGKTIIEIDQKYYQPIGKELSVGDYSKAYKKLGWKPKIGFKELVKIMTIADLKSLGK